MLLGHRDLKLSIKLKGEKAYKRVSVEYFGKLPGFNLTKVADMSPGSPRGRKVSSTEEEVPRNRKRTLRSDSNSPSCPDATRARIHDVSHDQAWDGF